MSTFTLPSPRRDGAPRFQILAMSGGGYRGLYSAAVLADFEQTIGRPIYECFDLFAGTSIGGIIAIGLAMENTAEAICRTIANKGTEIFPGSNGILGRIQRKRRSLQSLIAPKYDTRGLREAISSLVDPGAKLRDVRRALLVPAVAVTAGASQLFRTPHHDAHCSLADLKLIDIALATAAAPIYFPTATLGEAEYIDGGLIANAPDLAAVVEAMHYLGRQLDLIYVMSVGTTSAEAAFASRGKLRRGLASWLRKGRLLEVTFAAQQEHALEMSRSLLGERHFRINSSQSSDQADVLALDSATSESTNTLRAMASTSSANARRDARLSQFLAHRGRSIAELRFV